MKKVISVILTLSLLLGIAAISVSAEDKQYYEMGEYKLAYTVTEAEGDFAGRIMFIHGFLYSGTTWEYMADILSKEGYDCYLVDVPGFGFSTRECTVSEHIDREDLITGLMESIAPMNEWIVAGHSMGGGISLNIATAHPEIKALLLYCPAKITASEGGSALPAKLVAPVLTFALKIIAKLPFLVKLLAYSASNDWDYAMSYDTTRITDPLLVDGTMEDMCTMLSHVRATDLEKVKALTVPAICFWGSNDNVLGEAAAKELTEIVPAEHIVIDGGGHLIIENRASELCELTLDFLNK